MKDEIKELTDTLKECLENPNLIDREKAQRFYNGITNLQEENEKNKEYSEFYKDMSDKWKDMSDVFKKKYEDYKSRNEKTTNKIELLLKDLKDMQKLEKETGKEHFTSELFAIRIKEIYKLLQGSE